MNIQEFIAKVKRISCADILYVDDNLLKVSFPHKLIQHGVGGYYDFYKYLMNLRYDKDDKITDNLVWIYKNNGERGTYWITVGTGDYDVLKGYLRVKNIDLEV